MGSVGTLLMSQQLAVTPVQYGQTMLLSGLTMILGPLLSKNVLIATFTSANFSLVTSLCHSLSLVLKVGGSLSWYYVGLLPAILGGQRQLLSNADFVHQAQADGMESGEIAGAKANLDALIRVVAPVVYGALYSRNYRYPFYLAAGVTMVSQVVYRGGSSGGRKGNKE